MEHIDAVKDYYGKVLETKNDLKTTACCSAESLPSYLRPIVDQIHQDVRAKFYGCGVPIPAMVDGLTVLDLGSGSGRDGFLLSALVGDQGRVIGIDMTENQLQVARNYVDYHTKTFGLDKPNVEFRQGYIEDLAASDIADESVDLVVSNCVINLSPDKESVFSEIMRVLKPGGELYFSDVHCDRRLPDEARHDPILLGECLGGAMYWEDFRRTMQQLGCPDFRLMGSTEIQLTDPKVKDQAGNARFFSKTVRAFKVPLEDRCEDYGQIATYLGDIPHHRHGFRLDDHHFFETNKPMAVCANTAAMLSETRFKNSFRIDGNLSTHYGLFDCSEPTQIQQQDGGCC